MSVLKKNLQQEIEKMRQDKTIERIFATPRFFDQLVMETVLKLSEETEAQLWNQLCDNPGQYFSLILQGILKQGEHAFVTEYSKKPIVQTFNKKFPDYEKLFGSDFSGFSSGAVLNGDSGTGKSGVLNYLAMHALKTGWIVVGVPSSFDLTQRKTPK